MNEKEREVMQQALEALEYENSWHENFKVRPYASTIDAVAALRAALAQEPVASASPEELGYVPLSDDGRSVFIDGIGEVPLKLEPAQEPYAWHYTNNAGASVWHRGPSNRLDVDMRAARDYPHVHKVTSLYTAPPRREQVLLTNEEIDALPWNGSPRQFARAVEKAFLEKNK